MLQDNAKKLLNELKEGLKVVYGSRLKGLYLYGSYARGEQEEGSDFDILIVLDTFNDYGDEIDRTGYLASDLSLKYGISVSRFVVTEKDWKSRESAFLANVREEALAA